MEHPLAMGPEAMRRAGYATVLGRVRDPRLQAGGSGLFGLAEQCLRELALFPDGRGVTGCTDGPVGTGPRTPEPIVTDTATATAGPGTARHPRRVPPNFFAMPFGVAGLGEAWAAAGPVRDPVLSPFTSLAVITPMIPGAALAQANLTAGRVVVIVFAAATIALGGFLTGQWIVGDLDQGKAHPGYFLPTVAGGLVASYAAADVQLPRWPRACSGSACCAGCCWDRWS